jgi:hypothetical protein
MKKLLVVFVIALMPLLLLAPVGCQPDGINVVDHIMIFKSEPGDPPPPSGWALRPPNPYPEDIQGVFSLGGEIFFGLSLSSDISGEITFSKCTFLNQETGVEEQVGLADDLGPFEPGRTFLVGFEDLWPVPDTPGMYKIQIYLNDSVVASAVFEVSSEIIPASPPITSPPPPRTDWEEGSPPTEGLEGWEQPRSLTEDEKTNIIEIALNSQRASEWLQGRTDYRVGSADWYAIIWNSNGEARTWWSLEYDRVANEGIPDFVSPYAFWYPGVTIAVGEGTIYQMQITVDLDAGKTVMVMGPYPSLSSPDRFKNIP